uniref:Intraflagellar transport protein 74 homolog n=1 Tax=Steinernema glaseri TaxID=37863 RepID=A0A1I7YRV7_9BILA
MDGSRPTTARPKTSSGRAVSAARANRRPPTAGRSDHDRPRTPTGAAPDNANGMIVTGRGVSRAGVAPPSAMGSRVPSRLGAGQVGRPITAQRMIPPGTGHIRPLTQQGLAGVARTGSRAGTGFGNRQVFDKTYFVGVIRTKINALRSEIEMLSREVDKGERDRQNLIVYEQKLSIITDLYLYRTFRAEEEAGEIRELQGKLMDYNMIADRLHTNADMSQMEIELSELREKNAELSQSVEETFLARKAKEDEVKRLQMAVAQKKAENASLINAIDPEVRHAYERLKNESESVKVQVREKEAELDAVMKEKAKLEEEVNKSPLKQEAVLLYERLSELQSKKSEIENEMKSEGTPEELRERFVDHVKKCNEEMAIIQKQIAEVKSSIDLAHEELREFQTEVATASNDRSERVKELKTREEQMDKFMDTYPSIRQQRLEKLDFIGDEIVKTLTLISRNMHKAEASEKQPPMDENRVNNMLTSSVTADELQNVHLSIQEEMASLVTLKHQLAEDQEALDQRQRELKTELEPQLDEEEQKMKLTTQLEVITRKVRELEAVVAEVDERVRELLEDRSVCNSKLSGNEHFPKSLRKGNLELKNEFNDREKETNYEATKEHVITLQTDYNNILRATVTQKFR